jgi:AcrR family transcriptional regulator
MFRAGDGPKSRVSRRSASDLAKPHVIDAAEAQGDSYAPLPHVAPSPEPPSTNGDARAKSTRGRLLAAAYDLLVERGYQTTTVQNVARRAGLTTGAIYANFANKQELMAAAVLDRMFQPGTEVPAIMPDTDPDNDTDLLVGLLTAHLAAPAAPEHRLLTEVTGAVIREDRPKSPLFNGVQIIEALTRNSIEQAREAGEIAEEFSVDALVAIVVNLYLGAITTKAWGFDQPDPKEVLEILSAFTRGLAVSPQDT